LAEKVWAMIKYPRIWIAAHGGPAKAAQFENTPPAILRLLADITDELDSGYASSSNAQIRKHIAENPNTPTDLLRRLAHRAHWEVRAAVARNPNTPEDVLLQKCRDGNDLVRFAIIQNPNVTDRVLRVLVEDKEYDRIRTQARRAIAEREGRRD